MSLTPQTASYTNYVSLATTTRGGYRALIVGHAFDTTPAAITVGANTVGAVRTVSDITTAFSGATIDASDPASVLPFALARAVSPASVTTLADSQRPEVVFVLASEDSDLAYAAAIDVAVDDTRWNYVVTLRDTAAVRTSVAEMLTARTALKLSGTHVLTLDDPAGISISADLDAYAADAATLTHKVLPVWPHSASFNGTAVPGQMLAAAVAGQLGFTPPHQTLRNNLLEAGWASAYASGMYGVQVEQRFALGPVGFFALRYSDEGMRIVAPHTNKLTPEDDVWAGVVAVRDYVWRRLHTALSSAIPRADGSADVEIRSRTNAVLSAVRSETAQLAIGPMYSSYSIERLGVNQSNPLLYDVSVLLTLPLGLTQQLNISVNATIV